MGGAAHDVRERGAGGGVARPARAGDWFERHTAFPRSIRSPEIAREDVTIRLTRDETAARSRHARHRTAVGGIEHGERRKQVAFVDDWGARQRDLRGGDVTCGAYDRAVAASDEKRDFFR